MSKIIVILFFLLLITAMTFPLITGINTYIPGFFSTDESYAVVWNAWLIKHSHLNNLTLEKTDFISYPSGRPLYGKGPVGYIFFFINYSLAIVTNPVLTYNLQVVLNIFLVAFLTFILAHYITKNIFAGIFAGIIFGFSPYIFVRSWQHLGETYLWMMPMFLLGLFVLQKKPSKLIKAFCILGLVLATLNFNAVYYTIVIMSVFFIYQLLLNLKFYKNKRRDLLKENRRYLKNIIIVSLLAFLIVLPQFYPIVKNTFLARNTAPAAVNPYHRPFEDLFEQSARPLSYFLPAAVHPLFGKFTEQFIGSQLYGISFTEHTLYLGWVPLIFAFIAFKRWRKNRRLRTTNHEPRTDEFSYIGFFILLAIVAWFFSQPPWWQWGPLKIYMPSFFMYKVLPMFRAYCRFGIVLMLAVAVLAGFGLKFVLEKFNNKTTKTGIAVLVMLLVLFEFWNYPPFKVIDVSRFPAVYNWLRLEPKDTVIAEYPLDARDQNEMYKLYQTRHEKKMINASARGTQANNIALTITQLSSSRTAGILKWMGVRYVIVHSDGYLNTELIEKKEEFEQISKNPGLRIVRNFSEQGCPQDGIMCIQKTGPIDVYEVIASPIEPEVKE